jgi:hypothetical protein
MRTLGLGGLGVALALGCSGLETAVSGTPVPPPHADVVGHWTAPGRVLSITAGGRVDYERHTGMTKTSIHGGVTEWRSDAFVVLGLSTFHVDQAPHQTGSGWEMTVDGVVYAR